MKSRFQWKSALPFVASMPLLSSAVSAEIALAVGSQSSSELALTLASVPLGRPVTGGQYLGLAGDVPAGSPRGTGATVSPIYIQRTSNLHNPTLSTFHVTFDPGGQVVLHRAPSAGYVVVHVLSGAVTAWAWQAQVGVYRSGETWAEPAFAYDIATRNASAHEPAEALVVLITENAKDRRESNYYKSACRRLSIGARTGDHIPSGVQVSERPSGRRRPRCIRETPRPGAIHA